MSSLTNPSRLLEKNSEELDSPRLLLALPPADGFLSLLAAERPAGSTHVLTNMVEVREQASRIVPEANLVYSHDFSQLQGPFDLIVLYLQKSKPYTSAVLDQLCPLLTEQGRILLVGENGTGIKSWRKNLQNWGEVMPITSGCHSGLLELLPSEQSRSTNKGWEEKHFPIAVAGTEIQVASLPGVFSHGRLDVGTQLLLETLSKENIRGQLLDFGCGAGVIGSWQAKRHNRCKPTLLDTDAMALEAARRTLALNGLEGKVVASHGLSGLNGRYDWIISNPPFHEGVKTRYDVTENFLLQAKEHLNRGGQLRIVANSFLRYQPLIEEAFGHCEVLAQGRGFTIYGATLAPAFVSAEI
ncbi:methyltransferase [Parendozoicomonas haliclonae]|uniref:Ribosomal RNA small subunit methyltransferase C n=1 Tax=Parendozoicomonas haliclonae TaxID=1960125 RepID=A0A1X7AS43_9GAMM|nr:methyltransferase [Parendozoicomonas haliclonae]SMA50929.1 Ribosomal RNA small subunit methyltransferase C [Parendozoicomonas haliclonae]